MTGSGVAVFVTWKVGYAFCRMIVQTSIHDIPAIIYWAGMLCIVGTREVGWSSKWIDKHRRGNILASSSWEGASIGNHDALCACSID